MKYSELFEGKEGLFETVAGAIASVPTPLGQVISRKKKVKKGKYGIYDKDEK